MDLIEKVKILNNQLRAKNFKKVIDGSKVILKKNPNNDYILNMVGMAYQGLAQHRNSIIYFKEAIKFAPNNIAAMNNQANSLKILGDFEASKILYEQIIKINPNYIKAYNNYANLKTTINDYDGAIELYKKALLLIEKNNEEIFNSNGIGLLFSLAAAYQSINKISETKETIKEILDIDPTHAGAHKLLSSIIKYSYEDKDSIEHLNRMEVLNNDKNLNYEKKTDISFALGKSYEDLKDYEKAFRHLNEGNDLRFNKFGSNLENEKEIMQNIMKNFEDINFKEVNKDALSKKIIFICGMPRSGTTLTEQIISSHSEVYGAGELVYLQRVLKKNFFENSKIKKQNIIDNQSLSKNIIYSEYIKYFDPYKFSENIITDKAPQNFRWIGFIKLFFPNSKILHCFRNPKDNCLSLFKNSFASPMMNWSNKMEDIANYYNFYTEMMNFWKSKIPDFIYNVEYENLVQNKDTEIKNILNFCELKWDEKCLTPNKNSKTPIRTVSVSQARQPIYRSSVNSSGNFDKYLEKMYSILK